MEQFGGWYQKERKLPGSGGGAPGGGTPLPGFRIQTDPVSARPMPAVGNLLFSRRPGEKKKGPFGVCR